MRFGFRLLYHELAIIYDGVAQVVSLGQWWAWGQTGLAYLPAPESGWILELAYGTGHLQTVLHRGGWQTVGCDFSPQMARITASRLARQQLPIRLIRGKGQALPFAAAHFAGVICTFPTPFILETETLQELWRVIQPQGTLVIIPNAVLTKGGLAKNALEAAYQVTGQRGTWEGNLTDYFAQHGFRLSQEVVQYPRSQVLVWVAVRLPS